MFTEFLPMLITGAISVFVLFLILWLVHLWFKNAGIVDVGWGIGFIILCGVYFVQSSALEARHALFFLMVALWGLRITLFLLKRLLHDREEDKRYQRLRQEWGSQLNLKFFFFFEFQAVLQIILAVPFLIVSRNLSPGLSAAEIVGFIIWAVALIGETVADEQLHNFKSNPANRGKTCQTGFWYYSRHPNYFFEWLVWVGFFVFALGSAYGWVSVVSPILMYYLIIYISGVPLAEAQALARRGEEYRRYQEATSMFIPWFKKG